MAGGQVYDSLMEAQFAAREGDFGGFRRAQGVQRQLELRLGRRKKGTLVDFVGVQGAVPRMFGARIRLHGNHEIQPIFVTRADGGASFVPIFLLAGRFQRRFASILPPIAW